MDTDLLNSLVIDDFKDTSSALRLTHTEIVPLAPSPPLNAYTPPKLLFASFECPIKNPKFFFKRSKKPKFFV